MLLSISSPCLAEGDVDSFVSNLMTSWEQFGNLVTNGETQILWFA